MGLRSPYGNGPRNLQTPETGMQTLADTVAPVRLPNMKASPAPSQAPDYGDYNQPTPAPSQAPVQGNSADYGDYASPDLGDYTQPSAAPGPVQGPPEAIGTAGRVRRNADGKLEFKTGDKWGQPPEEASKIFEQISAGLMDHGPRIAGAIGGGMAGNATGIPGAGAVGAGLGSAGAGYLADMAQELAKIKSPETRDRLTKAMGDFTAGALGEMIPAGLAKGAGALAARWEGQAAVQPSMQEGAMIMTDRANQRISDAAQFTGADGQPLTMMRQEANLENTRLQGEVSSVMQDPVQRQVIAQIKESKRNAIQTAFDNIIAALKRPLEDHQASQPSQIARDAGDFHGFITDYEESMQQGLYNFHAKASEQARDRVFSVDSILEKLRTSIQGQVGEGGIFTQNGELAGSRYNEMLKNGMIPDTAKSLVGEYQSLWNKTRRSFGGTEMGNRAMPEYVEPFGNPTTGGFTERPVDTQVQMPFMSPGAPPKFGMTGTTSSLPPGSAGAAPELQMEMVHPGSAPGALGSEVQTPTGIQPGLSGGAWQQPGGPRMELGPNDSSGMGVKGLRYDELNDLRAKWQKKANFQGGQSRTDLQKEFEGLSGEARTRLAEVGKEVLGEVDPHAADMLASLNAEYSTNIEKVRAAQKLVEHFPSNAAAALVNPKNPKQLADVMSLLTKEQQSYLAGGYLQHLVEAAADREMGGLSSDTALNLWKKTDPKIKEQLYGTHGAKQVDAAINVMRAIDGKAGPNYDPRDDRLMTNILMMFKSPGALSKVLRGSAGFFMSIFKRNKIAADYMVAKGAEVFLPPSVDYRGRAALAQKAASVLSSMPAKAASQAGARTVARPTEDLINSNSSSEPTLNQMEQY